MADRIDAYTHVMPMPLYERLAEVYEGYELSRFKEMERMWNADLRLEEMDEVGIDRQIINIPGPHLWLDIDRDEALELTRLANDEIRRFADEHPDRFVPIGTIPWLTGPFVDEYDRCIEELDMGGVQIFTNIGGRPLDDPEFREFFSHVDDTGLPLWLHPQLVESYDWIDDYIEHKMLAWPSDTTLAVSRLIFGGVLDEFDDLRVITHHLGGTLPYIEDRIRNVTEAASHRGAVELESSLDSYFEHVYADTANNFRGTEPAMRCGLEFFGADRALFATDYPFGKDETRDVPKTTLEFFESGDFDDGDREQILGGNIARLIGD